MKHRTRLYFSAEQRADIWDRSKMFNRVGIQNKKVK